MEELIEDHRGEFALPYLDYTIVHSENADEHIEHIRAVLKKFQLKGLKLNPAKCTFCRSEVKYLGRIVSRDGYWMDEENVRAVKDLSNRKYQTVGEVRQLLGLLSFHRRYVQNFASIAKPLTELLGGDTDEEEDVKVKPGKKKAGVVL